MHETISPEKNNVHLHYLADKIYHLIENLLQKGQYVYYKSTSFCPATNTSCRLYLFQHNYSCNM